MKTAKSVRWIVIVLAMQNLIIAEERSLDNAPEGWTAESQRDEIRPNFSYEPSCGPNGTGCFVMSANGQSENMGQWTRIVPVVGGRHYSFRALRKATGIETPRRRTLVRITWQDDQGNLVQIGPGVHLSFKSSQKQLSKVQDHVTLEEEEKEILSKRPWEMRAYYEFPADRRTTAEGWTDIADVYLVLPDATQAKN